MLLYLVRLLMGHEIEAQRILVSVATTFLVSYAGTGFYVWYILRMAENELDRAPAKPPGDAGLDGDAGHDTTQNGGHEPAEFEENL